MLDVYSQFVSLFYYRPLNLPPVKPGLYTFACTSATIIIHRRVHLVQAWSCLVWASQLYKNTIIVLWAHNYTVNPCEQNSTLQLYDSHMGFQTAEMHETGQTQGGNTAVTLQRPYSYLMRDLGRTFIFYGEGCELINK